jgi:phosphonate transport system substrate-binding protein
MRLMTLLLLCGIAFASEPLIVALKPDKNPEAMATERQELATYLQTALGRPVNVIVPLSGAVILEGFQGGTVDLAYVSGTDLANAGTSAELLVAGRIAGRTTYDSLWVAKAGSTYDSVAALRGKPVAFASRTSTSGFLVPRLDLVKRGLITRENPDPATFFSQVFYGTGYVSAIERVLDGSAEAAAVSDYVMLGDKHLTAEQKAQLRIVQKQGPVPTHALAARASLPAADKAALRTALLALNDEQQRPLRDRLFVAELVETDAAAHLAVVREALSLVR